MGRYSKFIVAVIGAAFIALNTYFGEDVLGTQDAENVATVVIAILSAFGVERVTNA